MKSTKNYKAYISPAWQVHLDTIEHLSQSSQDIMLIVAGQDGGKSTFVKHFCQSATPHLHKQILNAHAETTVEDILHQVANIYGLEWDTPEELVQQVKTQVEEVFSSKQRISVLLIDDAHLLTNEQLQALIEFVQFEVDPWRQLHLIFVGEPSLEFRLFSPGFSAYIHGKVYTIELDPWNLSDLKNVFSKELTRRKVTTELEDILEVSRGLPGLVLQEGEVLFGQLKERKNSNGVKYFKRSLSLSISVGVLVGGAYLLFNHTLEEEAHVIPINEAQFAKEWPSEELAPKKEEQVVAQVEEVPMADEDMTPEVNKTAPLAANIPPVGIAQIESPPAVEAKIEEKKEEKIEKAEVKITKKTMPYTLQLLALSKEKNAKQFIKQHAMDKKAQYFQTKRAGKDWFVVVYGEYETATEAKHAAKLLQTSLKQEKIQPWVRKFDEIASVPPSAQTTKS